MSEHVLRRLKDQQTQLRVLNRCICLMLDEYSDIDEFLDQVVSMVTSRSIVEANTIV